MGFPPFTINLSTKRAKNEKNNQKATEKKPDAHKHAQQVFLRVQKGPAIQKTRAKKNQKKIYYKFLYIIKLKKYLEVSQFLLPRGLVKKY
jgi:hypothetical protein